MIGATGYHDQWSRPVYGSPVTQEGYRRSIRETLKFQMAERYSFVLGYPIFAFFFLILSSLRPTALSFLYFFDWF